MSPDDWSPSAATWAWAALGLAALATQAWALVSGHRDARLSRHVEAMRRHRVLRVPLIAGWAWLTHHWLTQPALWPRHRWGSDPTQDWIVIGTAAGYAATRPPGGTCE